jgi:prolyl oligopeptidase PreP (S9A serine peptidase family)
MMEDKLDKSSNFKFLEDKTSEEDLLWVTQKGDTMTTFFMMMSEYKNHRGAIGEIISAPSGMHLYIYYL